MLKAKTTSGRKVLKLSHGAAKAPAKAKVAPKPKPDPEALAPRITKKSQVISMLRSEHGATVTEVAAALGWQLHTTRAVISTLPKKDATLKVTSEKVEGRGRVYRLA